MEITCCQTEKRFIFKDVFGRNAEITFKRSVDGERFVFDKCVFTTKRATYDIDDWKFIGCLAKYIEGLNEAAMIGE